MTFPILQTSRLTLREHHDSDLDFLFEGLSNPKVTEYYDVHFNTRSEAESQLTWVRSVTKEGKGYMWVIIDKESEKPCGAAGVYDYDSEHQKAEIGYWLLPEFWGRGYAKEAVSAIHKYAFNEMEINRIEAYVYPGNTGSKAVLEKMNYTYEGLLRDYEMKDGKFVSYDLFTRLASD